MSNETPNLSKEEILDEIFIKEEDTKKELIDLVRLSKEFFMIEHETGNIVFNENKKFKNKEKIILLLIAKYFAKEKGILDTECILIADLAKSLDIPKTTLSKPLGELLIEKLINKSEDGKYSIIHHKIKPFLVRLTNNYGGDKNE